MSIEPLAQRNKLIQIMVVVIFLGILLVLTVPMNAHAQSIEERARLTKSALRAQFRSGDPAELDQRIEASLSKLEADELRRPNEDIFVIAVIKNGVSPAQLLQILDQYDLELGYTELKIAGGTDEPDTTISIGIQYIMASEGTLLERLENAIEIFRLNYVPSPPVAPNKIPNKNRPALIYTAGIIGPSENAARLARDGRIVAIKRHPRVGAAAEFEKLKKIFEALPIDQRIPGYLKRGIGNKR